MRQRRSGFLRQEEEEVVIRRENPQRRAGEPEFLYPIGESPIKALILPERFVNEVGAVLVQDTRYVCNITPPRQGIRTDDELVRQTSGEELTITESVTVQGIQQLTLVKKSSVV